MSRASDRVLALHDGRTLGYAEYGHPQGIPILLFHGMPGSRLAGTMFAQVAQAQGARVLVADRPGYATSSPWPGGTLLGYVDDVIAWADALELDRFAVLGVSGGGPFALACAAKMPHRVTCCGLMSAVGPLARPHAMDGMAPTNRIFFTLGRLMPGVVAALIARQLQTSRKAMQRSIDAHTSPVPEVSPELFAQLMADQFEAVRAGSKGIAFDMRIVTRPWGFPLDEVRPPVRMWHGAEDNLAPVALARSMAGDMPGCVLVLVPGSGHAGTFAYAEDVIHALTHA